ncbi:sensor domain-containing diguanylate cyclase [Vibrio harveyi]|nr:sensor domain-containing diguanylate cyclase [Vibrio harveyi]
MSWGIKVVFLISVLLLTELLATKLTAINNEKESELVISAINKEMKVIFNDALITAEVLKEVVVLSKNHDMSSAEFNKLSRKLLSTYTNVDALLYLPKGVVQYAYPYDEHKAAIGHNVLEDQTRKLGANQSVNCKKNTIIGPVTLVQNGKQAFILRKGISDDANFIGFSSSVIYLESIVSKLEQVLNQNHVNHYSVVGYDPDNSNYYDKVISSKGEIDCDIHTGVVTIFNTNWQISISPEDSGLIPRVVIFATLLTLLILVTTPVRYFNKFRHSEMQRDSLQNEAHTDYLTGLLNRRGLETKFEVLRKENTAGSIAVFDIDFFKSINDTYGHEVGDIVLAQFSKLCEANTSHDFTLSRTGGEEFMLLMPNTNARQAYLYCERVRKTVANTPVFINDMYIDITVSIGVAYFDGTDSLKDALREADRALYKAKNSGRNQVCWTR